MNISEAEVVVTTQQQIEQASHKSDWFYLADYGDAGEFYNTCCSCFPEECNPQFRYPAWENIPDVLINKNWFCPNFFEIRDAIEQLEELEIENFLSWCNYHGHNIAADDPYFLVANYQENHIPYPESDTVEMSDETYLYHNTTNNHFDKERYITEIFGENYD